MVRSLWRSCFPHTFPLCSAVMGCDARFRHWPDGWYHAMTDPAIYRGDIGVRPFTFLASSGSSFISYTMLRTRCQHLWMSSFLSLFIFYLYFFMTLVAQEYVYLKHTEDTDGEWRGVGHLCTLLRWAGISVQWSQCGRRNKQVDCSSCSPTWPTWQQW